MTDTQQLRRALKIYQAKTSDKIHVKRAGELLARFDDNRVFYRNHFDDGHFTGSILVVNKDKTKVLMMHHKKFGTRQQFGGHADGEVNIRDVAIRELEEEAGIQENDITLLEDIFSFDIHSVPAHGGEPKHYHYDISYLAIVSEDVEFIKQEKEIHDIQWFEISEILSELKTGKFSSGFERIFRNI